MKNILEICADSCSSCLSAQEGGADRLELCGSLCIGGVTPSIVFFRQARKLFSGEIRVMIRPRFGDFLYSKEELSEMKEEIEMFEGEGADGVVFGALTKEGTLDEEKLSFLLSSVKTKATLHRAFDLTKDPYVSLESAIKLGFSTILTSGQKQSAELGRELIAGLVSSAGGRIEIMAGAGVSSENLSALHEATGASAFHASAKKAIKSEMEFVRKDVPMGAAGLDERVNYAADREEIERMHTILKGWRK